MEHLECEEDAECCALSRQYTLLHKKQQFWLVGALPSSNLKCEKSHI
jgi:hypothetical protein